MQPSTNTQYANGNKTVILKIQTAFTPGQAVTISGLRLMNFGAPSSDILGAAYNNPAPVNQTPNITTAQTLTIVSNPTVTSAANQSINPPGAGNFVNCNAITIADGNPPGIWLTKGLRITIPPSGSGIGKLNMVWNTAITTVGIAMSGGGTVSTTLLAYEDAGKTAVLNVTGDFAAFSSVTVTGLQFANIGADSGPASLTVTTNGATGFVHGIDIRTKTIDGRPTVSTASNQVFTVGDLSTLTPQITVTSSPGTPTKITSANGIRLVLPNTNMQWDQTIQTAPPLVFGGAGAAHVSAGPTIVTYPNAQTALIALGSDFGSNEALTISGLKITNFTGAASAQAMTLNTVVTTATDNRTIAIGAPTLTSASNQIFSVNANPNLTIAAADIVVADDAQTPAVNRITAAKDIRIRIPTTPSVPNLVWDTSVTTVTFPAGTAVGSMAAGPNNVTYEDGGHTAVINVATDWSGNGQNVTIHGLVFKDFTQALTPRKLQLCVNGAGGTTAAQDPRIFAIGGIPKIDSAANQAFTVNDPVTNAQQITVTDAAGVPNITAAKDITIKIPTGFPMTWNTSITTPTFGGVLVTGIVSPTVSYPDARTLLINVTADFSAGDVLTINGLQFQNFSAAQAPDNLELYVDPLGAAVTDSKTVGIGRPDIAISSNQTFGVGDPSTILNPITITEDASVPRIQTATGIRIHIPAGLAMTWDNTVHNGADGLSFIGATGHLTGTPPIVTYEDLDKTAVINLQSSFAAGETLQISGLKLTNFSVPSAAAGLTLEVNNLNTNCRTTTQTLFIGDRPQLLAVRTADTNGNGSIDHIILTFNKNIDPLTASATNGLGFTISAPTYIIGAASVSGPVVTFTVVERGVPDTGVRPMISYNVAVGDLQEIGTALETSFTGPLQCADGAAAVVTGVSGIDADANGNLDTIVVTFSEALAPGQEDIADWKIVDADGTTDLLQGLTTSNLLISGNTVTFTLANSSGTTGTPRFLYSPNGNLSKIQDLAAIPNITVYQTNNLPPKIRVGPNIAVGPSKVILDASNSTDPNGQPLTFSWSGPPTFTLSNPGSAVTSFLATTAGVYTYTVTVSNALSSATANVQVTILNVPPGADAGSPQTVNPGQFPVYLVALASSDANGDSLNYTWSQLPGAAGGAPVTTLFGANSVVAYFVAPTPSSVLPADNILRFQVAVNDGPNTTIAQTIVRVNAPAAPAPTANAGPDQVAFVGDQVTLDGSLSLNPSGGALNYQWASTTPLSNNTAVNPFFVPVLPGLYTFSLVVTNPGTALSSAPSTVRVLVQPPGNQAPVAEAHRLLPTGEVVVGDLVVLDASGSQDPEGHALTYGWVQTAGPSVILATPQGSKASFTPVREATYSFQLIVGDGVNLSFPSSVSLTVKATPVDVTFTTSITGGTGVVGGHATLPGTFELNIATSDPGNTYYFYLEQVVGPAPLIDTLYGGGQLSFPGNGPYLITPSVPGYYEFRLAATSYTQIRAYASIGIIVDDGVTPYLVPSSLASGPLATVPAGQLVTLDSVGSTGATKFYWSQLEGPPVTLASPTAPAPSFTPVAGGQYTFALTTADGTSQSAPSFVVVTVSPAPAPMASSGGGNSGCGSLGLEGFLILPLIGLLSAFRSRLTPNRSR
jgi:hypothetical protein